LRGGERRAVRKGRKSLFFTIVRGQDKKKQKHETAEERSEDRTVMLTCGSEPKGFALVEVRRGASHTARKESPWRGGSIFPSFPG